MSGNRNQLSAVRGSRSRPETGQSAGMTSQHAIELFSTYQRGRSFSPHTIRRRRTSLSSAATFIAPMPLLAITTELVEEWLGTFQSPRTKHAYRSDLAAFFTWAVRRQIVPESPLDYVDTVRVPKALPRPVPVELVSTIIATATDPQLRLALALAAYAGLRRAEIVALTADDVSLHSQPPTLVVRDGKWSQDRLVPLHPKLVIMLSATKAHRFVPMCPDSLGTKASEHMRSHGWDYTLHQLRATFATELARATAGNVVLVAKMLGHSSIQTTMGYVGWSGGEGGDAVASMYAA